ncbi:MAG TPA: hypothetical protein VJC17_03365 [Candidatus Dojkabacteria bacterium]|nr:hypothetical protein [Candidatus Dojkabacteria bacterium]
MQLEISKLFNAAYLFDANPGQLSSQSTAFAATILSLGLSLLLLFLFTKDFVKYTFVRQRRLAIVRFLKINFGLSIALLIAVFLRVQQLDFLSMRVWGVVVLLLMLVNLVFTVIQLRRKIAKKETFTPVKGDSVVTSTDSYQKYLPRKKKKKK